MSTLVCFSHGMHIPSFQSTGGRDICRYTWRLVEMNSGDLCMYYQFEIGMRCRFGVTPAVLGSQTFSWNVEVVLNEHPTGWVLAYTNDSASALT